MGVGLIPQKLQFGFQFIPDQGFFSFSFASAVAGIA